MTRKEKEIRVESERLSRTIFNTNSFNTRIAFLIKVIDQERRKFKSLTDTLEKK